MSLFLGPIFYEESILRETLMLGKGHEEKGETEDLYRLDGITDLIENL